MSASDKTGEAEAVTIPKGYWEHADGSLMPVSRIAEIDKARDAVVRRLVEAAEVLSADLAKFKALAMSEIEQFIDLSAAQYNVTIRGAAGKGNVTLTSYDGRLKVERAIADRIAFDERLQVAKAGIDECIQRWGKGTNDNMKAVAAAAFRTNKAGKVSVSAVLRLRSAEITDPMWLKAMDAVADSMHAAASVAYLRIYRRNDKTGEYEPISLNAAAV